MSARESCKDVERSTLWTLLSRAFEPVHLRWLVLRPAMLSFTCAVVFALALGLTRAGREVLYHMAEGIQFGPDFSYHAWLRFGPVSYTHLTLPTM